MNTIIIIIIITITLEQSITKLSAPKTGFIVFIQ